MSSFGVASSYTRPKTKVNAELAIRNQPNKLQVKGRRSRADTTLQIRKAKKEEIWKQRRMQQQPLLSSQSTTQNSVTTEVGTQPTSAIPELMHVYKNWKANPASVKSDILIKTTKDFRRLLTHSKDPPYLEFIHSGAVEFLVEFLDMHQEGLPMVTFEAAWALTNLASSEHKFTKVVCESGAVQKLISLLSNPLPELREQAAWALGNVAGDAIEYRNGLLNTKDVIPALLLNLQDTRYPAVIQMTCWVTSNLCRGNPPPPMESVLAFVDPLVKLLNTTKAEQAFKKKYKSKIQAEILWTLSHISNESEPGVQALIDSQGIPSLMRLLESIDDGSRQLLYPLVLTIQNITMSNESHTQQLVDSGFLDDHVEALLSNTSKTIRRHTCWALSNIFAGTTSQIECVLGAARGQIMTQLISKANGDPWEVRKEATWAIVNFVTMGTKEQVQRVARCHDLVKVLAHSLVSKGGAKLLLAVLDAIQFILKLGWENKLNYARELEEANGLVQLENLQNHPNYKVYEKAHDIIEAFFGAEYQEDEQTAEDQNVKPEPKHNSYSFGISKQLFPAGSPNRFSFGEIAINIPR